MRDVRERDRRKERKEEMERKKKIERIHCQCLSPVFQSEGAVAGKGTLVLRSVTTKSKVEIRVGVHLK